MRRTWRGSTALAAALLVALAAACTVAAPASAPGATAPTPTPVGDPTAPTPTPVGDPTPPTPPPTEVGRLTQRAQVGCAIAKAFGGPPGASTLAELADCSDPVQAFTPIPEGGLVTTDTTGEAWIDTDDCGRIFLFQGSSLKTSPCRADTPATGQFCLLENSAAWQNDCSGAVSIVTPTGAVSLQGTWLSVTYDPNREVTLVCVFEGRAIATPFAEVDGRDAGRRAIVEAGSFWFTSPDNRMDEVGGLEPRRAYDFEQLPAVMNELGLRSWFTAIGQRARADGVPMQGFPELAAINVRGGGGLLARADVQDALLLSTDWESETFRVFPDGDGAIIGLMGSGAPRDLSFSGADFERAFAILKEAGAGGLTPWILVESDDRMVELAKILAGNLLELGLEVRELIVSDSPADAARTYDELVAADVPVMWLARR